MPDDAKDKLAMLEKELYAKEFKPHATEDILTRKAPLAAPSWDTGADAMTMINEQAAQVSRHKKMKKFVQISIGFFVVALAVTGFIWWRGSNVISGDNIAIDISSPTAVAGGAPFETTFAVTNNNAVAIDQATLLVEYPSGFYSVAKVSLPRISKDLGAIAPGQSVSEKMSTILFGEQNTNKEASVTLEYRLAGSNATLKKVTTYAVKISSSPVNIQLATLSEASSGQSIDLTIDVASNSQDPLSQLLVTALYPSGFNFVSASPSPTYGANSWAISALAPQEKRTITVHGTIEGSENEVKITNVTVGTQDPTDGRLVGTIYNAISESMTITKPFVAVDLAVDNDHAPVHVVSLGRGVRTDISWQSNNPTEITDAVISVKLRGEALNRYLIYASGGGFYRSIDDTIVWNKAETTALATIEPGARGSVSFGFSPVALGVGAGRVIKNPQINLDVTVNAHRISDTGAIQNISTFASRVVKFETDLRLTARGLYFSGPFNNTGAMPPRVEKETTYTIALSARNSSNNVSNVTAKTTLPIYAKWLGAVSPSGEDVEYDQNTNQVTWNVGRMTAGSARDVDFQISFLPSLSQLRQSPDLTGPVSLVGNDDFTGTMVQDSKPAITTYLSSDPTFVQGQATVVN